MSYRDKSAFLGANVSYHVLSKHNGALNGTTTNIWKVTS